MNAKYAYLLSTLYKGLDKSSDVTRHCLYRALYPRIASHILKGQTRAVFKHELPTPVEEELIRQGYALIKSESPIETTIDWSYPPKT